METLSDILKAISKIWPKKDGVSQIYVVVMVIALIIGALAFERNDQWVSILAIISIFILAVLVLCRGLSLESRRLMPPPSRGGPGSEVEFQSFANQSDLLLREGR
jgi:hypothetical protein